MSRETDGRLPLEVSAVGDALDRARALLRGGHRGEVPDQPPAYLGPHVAQAD